MAGQAIKQMQILYFVLEYEYFINQISWWTQLHKYSSSYFQTVYYPILLNMISSALFNVYHCYKRPHDIFPIVLFWLYCVVSVMSLDSAFSIGWDEWIQAMAVS